MNELEYAYKEVESRRDFPTGARLSEINAEAIRQTVHTWKRPPGHNKISFSWPILMDWDFSDKSNMFSLAIWNSNNSLQALSAGRVVGVEHVRLDVLEAIPQDGTYEGGIFKINHNFLEAYARILGISEIRIKEPVDGLIDYYCSFGYTLFDDSSEVKYCQRFL